MNKNILKGLPRGLSFALMGGVAFIVLAGCSTSVYRPSYENTGLRNKITVAETVERLEMYVGSTGLNLSARDEDAVSNFIAEYSRSGQGPLYVNIPANAAQGAGVVAARNAVASRLQSMGISRAALQSGQYASKPGAPAPVVLSYRRLTTEPIECHAGASLTHTSNNQPYGGFGCSQTANLAAMIDDPRQLLAPHEFVNGPADRRAFVLDRYTAGEATATPRPDGQEVSATSGQGG